MNIETNRSVTLQKAAGWSLVGIAAAHVLYFALATNRSWAGWLAGDLRAASVAEVDERHELTRSALDFWALPGGFAVPLALLGLVVVLLARHRIAAPAYVTWGIAGWAALSLAILFPSGFALGVVPTALFIAAAADRRRATPRVDVG